MQAPQIHYRKAIIADIPSLTVLIAQSARGLATKDYSHAQIEAAIGTVWGVDEELIHDQTFFIAETAKHELAGCGGWSKRAKLFGSSEGESSSPLLNPIIDSSRIRAFFVHPDFTRLGIGRRIIQLCEQEAIEAGFTKMQLMATLPGHRLYKSCGYIGDEIVEAGTSKGNMHECVAMYKNLNVD